MAPTNNKLIVNVSNEQLENCLGFLYVWWIKKQGDNGVYPKWSRTFIEFSKFRESDKSLKNELGLI